LEPTKNFKMIKNEESATKNRRRKMISRGIKEKEDGGGVDREADGEREGEDREDGEEEQEGEREGIDDIFDGERETAVGD
jgi:hypothetical protein